MSAASRTPRTSSPCPSSRLSPAPSSLRARRRATTRPTTASRSCTARRPRRFPGVGSRSSSSVPGRMRRWNWATIVPSARDTSATSSLRSVPNSASPTIDRVRAAISRSSSTVAPSRHVPSMRVRTPATICRAYVSSMTAWNAGLDQAPLAAPELSLAGQQPVAEQLLGPLQRTSLHGRATIGDEDLAHRVRVAGDVQVLGSEPHVREPGLPGRHRAEELGRRQPAQHQAAQDAQAAGARRARHAHVHRSSVLGRSLHEMEGNS